MSGGVMQAEQVVPTAVQAVLSMRDCYTPANARETTGPSLRLCLIGRRLEKVSKVYGTETGTNILSNTTLFWPAQLLSLYTL